MHLDPIYTDPTEGVNQPAAVEALYLFWDLWKQLLDHSEQNMKVL